MSPPGTCMACVNVYAIVALVAAFLVAPLVVFLLRRTNSPRMRGNATIAVCSGIAWTLGLASALLYFGSAEWAHARGGFPFYDPVLMRIYRVGFRLSLLGIVFGLVSVWRAGKVRWGAVTVSILAAGLWIVAAMGE